MSRFYAVLATIIVLAMVCLAMMAPAFVTMAYSADKTCAIATESEFRANVAPLKPKIFRANEKALAAILGKFNESRKARKMFILEADKLIVGIFAKGPQMMAGMAMFKDGCVVPGSVQVVPVDVWAEFLSQIGIRFEDFRIEASA